jgi:hypothetical protein
VLLEALGNSDVSSCIDCEKFFGRSLRDDATAYALDICNEVKKAAGTHPWMIASLRSSRPFSTSVTSTFLRHAFLPFRDGCLNVPGACVEPLRGFTTGILKLGECKEICLVVPL